MYSIRTGAGLQQLFEKNLLQLYCSFISLMIVAFVALAGVEEVITGFLGRLIWRRQYKLGIPESEE